MPSFKPLELLFSKASSVPSRRWASRQLDARSTGAAPGREVVRGRAETVLLSGFQACGLFLCVCAFRDNAAHATGQLSNFLFGGFFVFDTYVYV